MTYSDLYASLVALLGSTRTWSVNVETWHRNGQPITTWELYVQRYHDSGDPLLLDEHPTAESLLEAVRHELATPKAANDTTRLESIGDCAVSQ